MSASLSTSHRIQPWDRDRVLALGHGYGITMDEIRQGATPMLVRVELDKGGCEWVPPFRIRKLSAVPDGDGNVVQFEPRK